MRLRRYFRFGWFRRACPFCRSASSTAFGIDDRLRPVLDADTAPVVLKRFGLLLPLAFLRLVPATLPATAAAVPTDTATAGLRFRLTGCFREVFGPVDLAITGRRETAIRVTLVSTRELPVIRIVVFRQVARERPRPAPYSSYRSRSTAD